MCQHVHSSELSIIHGKMQGLLRTAVNDYNLCMYIHLIYVLCVPKFELLLQIKVVEFLARSVCCLKLWVKARNGLSAGDSCSATLVMRMCMMYCTYLDMIQSILH